MKTTHYLLVSFILLMTAINGHADKLPSEYAPFKKLIGRWSGENRVVTFFKEGKVETALTQTVDWRYDDDRYAIVMTKTELVHETGITYTSQYEIRWDESSRSFKAMGWARGRLARLYIVRYNLGVFYTEHLDGAKGVEFISEVGVDAKGRLFEKGRRASPGEDGVTTEWNNHYTRSK